MSKGRLFYAERYKVIKEGLIDMNWKELQEAYETITAELSAPSLDYKRRIDLQKKSTHYSILLTKHRAIEKLKASLIELNELARTDEELQELYQEEITTQQGALEKVEFELDEVLYPPDERDSRSVFLEIRAGTGGQEAALFAADLFRMYANYAASKNWQVSVVNTSQTGIGGYKELIAYIKGKNVYKYLKYESGVHRVQRVPATEAAGRVHTSTVTVAILSEAQEVDVTIDPNDLRIDVYRSSGPGGQSVNTTDSAVRIIHLPTDIVVTCQDERSQIKNKAKAMKILQARLFEAEKQRQEAEMTAKRRKQIGAGERAEKIRTYNFPQNRITDHRINLTLKRLAFIMEGDLDVLVDPLVRWGLEQRKKEGLRA